MDQNQATKIVHLSMTHLINSNQSSFDIKLGNVVVNTFPVHIDGQLFLVMVKKGAK